MTRSYWPGFREKVPRQRKLALLLDDSIEVPQPVRFKTWEELKTLIFSFSPTLELYTTNLIHASWFSDAISDPSASVFIPASAMLQTVTMMPSVKIRGPGNRTAWILSSHVWDQPVATGDFLGHLDYFFEQCGVGVRPTPGSLGQAVMRECWQDSKRRWERRPTNSCRIDVIGHAIGGRVDYLVSPKEQFEKVFKHDLSSAYASVCDRLPSGEQVVLHAEPGSECVTWQMECRVTIPEKHDVLFGIFAEKTEYGNMYPTTAGEYRVWLWKEEADLCRRKGWMVVPCFGWGWMNWNTGLKNWAQRMYHLRLALASCDSLYGQWVKKAIVASLGRFGMPLFSFQLLPEEMATEGDMALYDGMIETGLVLHREHDWNSNHLSHWYSYILMRCRLILRARMEWEYRRGNRVLTSNYDAIYCLLPAELGTCGLGLGEWKETVLTNVSFPYPRAVASDTERAMPGRRG